MLSFHVYLLLLTRTLLTYDKVTRMGGVLIVHSSRDADVSSGAIYSQKCIIAATDGEVEHDRLPLNVGHVVRERDHVTHRLITDAACLHEVLIIHITFYT